MSKLKLLIIIFFLINFKLSAQNQYIVVEKANELIKNKQYNKAFLLLDEFDSENLITDIVLKKTDILLNYNVYNIYFKKFGLADLDNNMDINSAIKSDITYSMYSFDIDKILQNLLNSYPEEWRLYNAIGDYYFSMLKSNNYDRKYNIQEILDLSSQYLSIAKSNSVVDYKSLFALGYLDLIANKQESAKNYFLESYNLNKMFPYTPYYLSYCNLVLEKNDDALSFAKIAFELFQDSTLKSDPARIIGIIYEDMNNYKESLSYLNIANNLSSNNLYTLLPLLKVHLRLNNIQEIETKSFQILNIAPSRINILTDIYLVYNETNNREKFIDFLNTALKVFNKNNDVLFNIYYHFGSFYEDDKNLNKANGFYNKAKNISEKYFTENDPRNKLLENKTKKQE